ncbi:MAG: hypothetical protein QM749_13265 [Aquabacterium sp.]
MPRFFNASSLPSAWVVVMVWVLAYGLLKAFSLNGLDIDSAEQVYFAQSWQMGYGTRQPPLYTWLILAFKPASLSWVATLEVARYACLLLWLGGVQALAAAMGANRSVQARVLLAHLGLLLAMWRVHDSLTHTVLAGAVTVWGSAAVIKALSNPRYWMAAGVLAGLACLSKLNAALWCVSSFAAALVLIVARARDKAEPAVAPISEHVCWLVAAVFAFLLVLSPYADWWLTHSHGSLALAKRIVVSEENLPVWQPIAEVILGALEYLLVTPLIMGFVAWRLRAHSAPGSWSMGVRWVSWQLGLGLLMLALVLTMMKASHFTPRWLWPVVPAASVWLSVLGFQAVDGADEARWHRLSQALVWGLPVLALCLVAARVWEPRFNAQRCRSCWTDRPAAQLSAELHRRHGQQPLRLITGDDHLAGILAQVSPKDRAATAVSPDLPPPADFAHTKAPCVAVWLDMDKAASPPSLLADLIDLGGAQAVQSSSMPLRLAPQRRFWLQSRELSADVCDKAVL